jgi:hypothetical protein
MRRARTRSTVKRSPPRRRLRRRPPVHECGRNPGERQLRHTHLGIIAAPTDNVGIIGGRTAESSACPTISIFGHERHNTVLHTPAPSHPTRSVPPNMLLLRNSG